MKETETNTQFFLRIMVTLIASSLWGLTVANFDTKDLPIFVTGAVASSFYALYVHVRAAMIGMFSR